MMAMASCVALAACGGGGGGGGGAGPVSVTSGGAATPAPTPSPSASPSPTPTPSPPYALAFDFAADRSFFAFGAELRQVGRYATAALSSWTVDETTVRLLTEDNMAMLTYTSSNQSLSANFARDTITFASSDNMSRSDQFLFYYSTAQQSSIRITRQNPAHLYVLQSRQELERRLANGSRERLDRFGVFGVATVAADLPTTGVSSYPVVLSSTAPTRNGVGGFTASGSLRVDHASGAVSGTLSATELVDSGLTPLRATLTFSGSVSPASGEMDGTITSADSGFTGDFDGRLFGPRGVEAGAAFTLARSDGVRVAGGVVGRR